ncbi:MAG: Crp/Fnr family transcriptional regulator [Saprospiraceae bacterium]|nr:Crp/Fnr family transcriptional regulator [Saprospiraceae bacterium]
MQAVLNMVEIKRFEKGSLLLQEGQYAKACYYNVQGCVRQFYLKGGEEKTTFFYTEEQSISSLNSTIADTPVDYYLECTEDTILAVMSHEKEEELYSRFPRFESLCRQGLERQIAVYHNLLTSYMTSSPEERYLQLIRERPKLIHRVPQYQLASYLGVKPESLSRIRKRILTKKELRS